jgi:hypothetical protein
LPLTGEAIVKFHGLAAPRRIPADHFIHLSVIEAFERIAGYVPHALTHAGETPDKEAVKARLIRWARWNTVRGLAMTSREHAG